jgi:hypothetical protein
MTGVMNQGLRLADGKGDVERELDLRDAGVAELRRYERTL